MQNNCLYVRVDFPLAKHEYLITTVLLSNYIVLTNIMSIVHGHYHMYYPMNCHGSEGTYKVINQLIVALIFFLK